MGKLNRWDVVDKVDSLDGTTKSGVTAAFAGGGDEHKVDDAFDSARRHGLIESEAGDAEESQWVVSAKGRRKLADRS
jgi:hypothetical protein